MALTILEQMNIDGSTNAINAYKVVKTLTTEFLITSVTICNQNSSAVSVRLAFVMASGATNPPDRKAFVLYDHSIGANKTLSDFKGFSLEDGAVIVFYSNTTNVNIIVSGDSK